MSACRQLIGPVMTAVRRHHQLVPVHQAMTVCLAVLRALRVRVHSHRRHQSGATVIPARRPHIRADTSSWKLPTTRYCRLLSRRAAGAQRLLMKRRLQPHLLYVISWCKLRKSSWLCRIKSGHGTSRYLFGPARVHSAPPVIGSCMYLIFWW